MCATKTQEVPENFYRPSHGRSLNWYVRLVPPLPLRSLPGVKEFRKSTGTADLRRAKAIGASLIAEKRAEWEQLLSEVNATAAPRILTEELINHICAQRLYHWMQLDDSARIDGDGYSHDNHQAFVRVCVVTEKSMRAMLVQGRASEEVEAVSEALDYWCSQIGISVSQSDPSYIGISAARNRLSKSNSSMLRTPYASRGEEAKPVALNIR